MRAPALVRPLFLVTFASCVPVDRPPGGITGLTGIGAEDAGSSPKGDGDADAGPTDDEVDGGVVVDAGTPPPRRVIYQLVVRTFSNVNDTRNKDGTIEQNGVGKFNDINEAALRSLKDMGITDVWFTGVLRQATLTDHSDVGLPADDPDVVKGRAGSLYAIRDYFDVSPDYAVDKTKRLDEFRALIQRAHAVGLRVHIDLVPNHVARGYRSVVKPDKNFGLGDDRSVFFKKDNHFYYLPAQGALRLAKPTHWTPPGLTFDSRYPDEDASSAERTPRVTGLDGRSTSPSENEWYETVKLNYGVEFTTGARHFEPVPSTWRLVDEILAYWQELGVDGFRCDFAHVIPNEAWSYLIGRAKERVPGTFFFAEAYADRPALKALITAGFDAIYNDPAVDELKRIYQGRSGLARYAQVMEELTDDVRGSYVHYLENHDERRIASGIVVSDSPDDTGFGGMRANYQLAPLLYLVSHGPVLIFNGQEVGEPGAGTEGFSTENGRTSIFDYWSMPELQRWVNGHAYDGANLTEAQRALRGFLRDLLRLSQHELAVAKGYWNLYYYNRAERFPDASSSLYSFARFAPKGGRLLLVIANFRSGTERGQIRVPPELATAAGLADDLGYRALLDSSGAKAGGQTAISRAALSEAGIPVELPDQASLVLEIGPLTKTNVRTQ